MFKLRPISEKPILAPIAEHEWEKEATSTVSASLCSLRTRP